MQEVPGAVAGSKWGNPCWGPVAGRVMGPGVGAQRHPQMDVRDATGLEGLVHGRVRHHGHCKRCQWNRLKGPDSVAPKILEL